MKAVVAAFNQEKALVGAFSVITNLRMELFQALENMLQCSPWYLHSCTEHAHTRIALCSQWVTTIRWNSDGHLHTGGGILTLLDITDNTDYLTCVFLHHVGLELSLKVLMRQQIMFSRNISISCWVEAKCVESIPCIWFTYRGLMLSCWAQESRHQDPLSSTLSTLSTLG